MKRLLVVLILVVAGVVGLGFYLGWFGLTSGGGDNKLHLTVDKEKMQEDKKKALEKLQDLGDQVEDKAAAPAEARKDQPAPPVQPPRGPE